MKSKIFIPKLIQNEAGFVEGRKIPAVIMDAYIVSGFPNPSKEIKKSSELFIIDPNTNYFTGGYCKEKKSFEKLPTTPIKPYKVTDLLTNESVRKYDFVLKSIQLQVDRGADFIILPYLYSDGIDDSKFGLNLTMISDGLRIIKEKGINLPVYAMINYGNGILGDYQKLDQLIDRYLQDFDGRIDGYFVMVNQFNCRKASEDELLGLTHLSFHLSEEKNVYFLKMGDFGELLCCVGASGYSSSLGGGEIFNSEGLSKKLPGFGRKHGEITYVSELFDYLNDEALKKTGYKCSCAICRGNGLPNGYNETKAHFLEKKLEKMKKISSISDDKKIDFIVSKVEEAIELANRYNIDYALSVKTDFLIKWKNVLEKARHWKRGNTKQKEIDLDKLIEEAKSQKNKK